MITVQETVLELVNKELTRARAMHGPMHSAHEANSIIREEYEEWWDEVKVRESIRCRPNMRKELVQLAAMACRAIIDLDLLVDTRGCK